MNRASLDQLIDRLARLSQLDESSHRLVEGESSLLLADASPDELGRVLAALAAGDLIELERRSRSLLAACLAATAANLARVTDSAVEQDNPQVVASLGEIYRRLGPGSRVRFRVLEALALGRGSSLAQFADLVAIDPPRHAEEVLPAFAPLFRRSRFATERLFPRLFDAMESPVVAAAILDLANYLTRSGRLTRHPAADRAAALAALLTATAERLQILDEQARKATVADPSGIERAQQERQEAARQVADAAPLCVALCDALALIGDRAAVGAMRRALGLSHRRIQAEAAGALARLEEQEGLDTLARLCDEPVARLRALSYLDELGQLDRVPEAKRSPLARAEAALACWLSEPAQFGFPPARLELVDQRTLFWPGYGEMQACYLFRYTYPVADGRLTGIGIAGPATTAVACDLEDFPPPDIYALYAGMQADHAEIRLTSADALPPTERRRLEHRLTSASDEYRDIELVLAGTFFGDALPIATARRGERSGTIILDEETVSWYPRGNERAPLMSGEAWSMYIGRKLLKTFNPELDASETGG